MSWDVLMHKCNLSSPMSPTRKSACDLLNLLWPRRSCSGVWGSSATSSVPTLMRIIHVPPKLASMTRRRSGVVLVKHGYAPSRTTSNIRTWDCDRPGTELMTVICGVISWKRRRSCRGMLHDDDDESNHNHNPRIIGLRINDTLP